MITPRSSGRPAGQRRHAVLRRVFQCFRDHQKSRCQDKVVAIDRRFGRYDVDGKSETGAARGRPQNTVENSRNPHLAEALSMQIPRRSQILSATRALAVPTSGNSFRSSAVCLASFSAGDGALSGRSNPACICSCAKGACRQRKIRYAFGAVGEGLPRPEPHHAGPGRRVPGAQFTGPGCCSITHHRPRPAARKRSW